MSQFVLQASRQVSDMAAGAIHIQAQIQAIETAIEQSPAFEGKGFYRKWSESNTGFLFTERFLHSYIKNLKIEAER